jgi:hypothetical protein
LRIRCVRPGVVREERHLQIARRLHLNLKIGDLADPLGLQPDDLEFVGGPSEGGCEEGQEGKGQGMPTEDGSEHSHGATHFAETSGNRSKAAVRRSTLGGSEYGWQRRGQPAPALSGNANRMPRPSTNNNEFQGDDGKAGELLVRPPSCRANETQYGKPWPTGLLHRRGASRSESVRPIMHRLGSTLPVARMIGFARGPPAFPKTRKHVAFR